MSTSGSTDYSVNRDDIIKRALRLVSVTAQGGEPTTDKNTDATYGRHQDRIGVSCHAWVS